MSKVILLVDDDSGFRESVRDILDIGGYQVIEAEDGKEALPIIEKEKLDLVITDILMPEIEGIELYTKIEKIRPDLKIIGMSGGGRLGTAEDIKHCVSHIFETMLSKPFTKENLMTEVVAALA